ALVGENGAGKSSFFSALLGGLTPDAGTLSRPQSWTVAHMAQEVAALNQSALDFVLDGDKEWRAISNALETEQDDLKLAELYGDFDTIDGYTAPARAATLLAGLGFSELAQQKMVSEFSGGWRMRLNLAQALMCRSDLLMLDEPTNHLDLDAILWLEDWLNSYQGTLILISHDRDFLDATVGHILHIEQQTMTLYTGNYSTFERTRAERLAQHQQAFEKQQSEMAHLQKYIDRFRAQATKARQAQSRIKQLERMVQIAPAHVDSAFSFSFREPIKLATPLIRLDEVNAGYGDKIIVNNINLNITPDSRIGLLGPNGAGKSTLIKTFVGELPLLAGERIASEHLLIGYFAQHQVDHLDMQASPLLALTRIAPRTGELELRKFLGGFGFNGDRVTTTVENFSGGEKARLALALIVWQRPNVLVLDEPTNHLDLEMRHALSMALQAFTGALIVVSHDRQLLGSCCDEFMLVADGQIDIFGGSLVDYAAWLKEWRAKQELKVESTATRQEKRQERQEAKPTASGDNLHILRPLRQQAEKLEAKFNRLTEQQSTLATQLEDMNLYQEHNKDKLKKVLAEKSKVDSELAEVEVAYLQALEAYEVAGGT
ncbi:MAG: ATP-binding cassette domain-containing protein, partial [Pseudomonadales bacterium]|nr:ATP-binding cassette domain-containing protein [Pseudomonadales bacterium]